MGKGNTKVLISLISFLLISTSVLANDNVVEGTRVVAGNLQQNEFYILAKDEAKPVNEIKPVANTTKQPTQMLVKANTTKQPTKMLVKANIMPATTHKIKLALKTANKQKKHLATKKPEKLIVLKPTLKKNLQASNSKIKHHANKTPSMLHTLDDVKRLEARMAQAMPEYQPLKQIKSHSKSGYKEVASYTVYDGERRKVISYVAEQAPKKVATTKTLSPRMAFQAKKLKPTISLNDK